MILVRTETGGTVTEQYDTSMIPDDAAYWAALSDRIVTGALRRRTALGWIGTSPRAWIVAASLGCAAALGGSAWSRLATRIVTRPSLPAVLVPQDRLARALLEPQTPPLLTTLTIAPPAGARDQR